MVDPSTSGPQMMSHPRWRVGRTLGRTLYLYDKCVGMVDTPEIAAEIVAAMNAAPWVPRTAVPKAK